MSDFTHHHPSLGCSLRGKASAASVQYRNLKYASIPSRFQQSVAKDTLNAGKDGVFDATKFGPSCPQKRGGQAFDVQLAGDVTLQCEDGQGDTEVMDELECLHVNVTVPKSVASTKEGGNAHGLPVFVLVHGGSLCTGSNSWPQYDLRRFVDRSVEIGKPVIGVAMNYRLGVFGFAASKELGAPGNMGFKDQVLAFRWVKKHIAGFGGDPNNVTAAGESAGGISLSTLLCADVGEQGLFERVIVMSGNMILRKPRNARWHEHMYKHHAKLLGIPTSDLKPTLLTTDAEALAQQLPLFAAYTGLLDGQFFHHNLTLPMLADATHPAHKPTWCTAFVIGDTLHDATVLKALFLDRPRALDAMLDACATHLSAAETSRLLAAYRIDLSVAPEDQLEALYTLISEPRFYVPAVLAHRGWSAAAQGAAAHRYHFHARNPWPGMFQGLASHELDLDLLLQNYNEHLAGSDLRLARDMADRFVAFCKGEGWCGEGKVLVFGPDGVQEVGAEAYDRDWREGRGEVLLEIGAERCMGVMNVWQGVVKAWEEEEVEEEVEGEGVAKL